MITTELKLALHGGTPTVAAAFPRPVRWDDAEREQLASTIDQPSLFYWNGAQTNLLIERFRQYYSFEHVMPCSSGTAAIHIAISAAGIEPGDEVIVPPVTDMGTVIGILFQQAVPVFADVDPARQTLDPADVARKITPRTKAIVAVHLWGCPCDLQGLQQLADQHNLVLIEDCAQAWGTMYRGRHIGTIGDIGCYSLNDFKHIGCGDGGLVGSNDPRFGPILQRRGDKDYDRADQSKSCQELAANYRISEPQSAVAAVQMTRMWDITEQRSLHGRRLGAALAEIPGILPIETDEEDRCTFWRYAFRFDPAQFRCTHAEFGDAMSAEGVPCETGASPGLLYKLPVFQNHSFFAGHWPVREFGLTTMDYTQVQCPQAEALINSCYKIFINEAMTDEHIDSIAAAIAKVAEYYRA